MLKEERVNGKTEMSLLVKDENGNGKGLGLGEQALRSIPPLIYQPRCVPAFSVWHDWQPLRSNVWLLKRIAYCLSLQRRCYGTCIGRVAVDRSSCEDIPGSAR